MEKGLAHTSRAEGAVGSRAHTKVLVVGLFAGLLATIVIDLLTVGVMPLLGSPADSGFVIIGDTAAGFFALFGMNVSGGALPGLVWHYAIGLALGVLFGAGVTRIDALRLNSTKKGVGLGILFAEVISLPIVVMPPIVLSLTASAVGMWLGFCLVMHGIWGTVLGLVVSYGLRPATAAKQG